MAVEKIYTTDNDDTTYDITFPFITSSDVKVSLAGVTKSTPSDYTISGTVVTFGTAPANNLELRLYRNTNIDNPIAEYTAGSSIKASDLNENHKQLRYKIEEVGTVVANDEGLGLVAGSKGDIHVNTATDWYIRDGVVENSMLADFTLGSSKLAADCINATKIADNSIDSEHYVDGSIDTAHIGNLQVTAAKIADATITSAKLTAAAKADIMNPVGTVIWFAGSTAPTGYLKCNGDSIPNGSGTVQSISSDFSTLYGVIGSSLPDIRGEFIRGWDDGKGTDSGRSIRSWQAGDFYQHSHTITVNNDSATHYHNFPGDDQLDYFDGTSGWSDTYDATKAYDATSNTGGGWNGRMWRTTTHDDTHNHTASSANSGGTHTRPRNVALLACIKY